MLILSVQDIRKGEVDLRVMLLMVDFRYPYAYLFLLLFLVFYERISEKIGGADLWLFCLLMSRYGLRFCMKVLWAASLSGIVYCLIKDRREIRWIPFLSAGFLCTYFRLI